MRYCPAPSLDAVRIRSIRTGLDASMVTPGNTPPEGSLTVPASVTCASAAVEKMMSPQTATRTRVKECMPHSFATVASAGLGILLYRKTPASEDEYPRADRRGHADARDAVCRRRT